MGYPERRTSGRFTLDLFLCLSVMGTFSSSPTNGLQFKLRAGGPTSGIVVTTYQGKDYDVCLFENESQAAGLICSSMGLPSSRPVVINPSQFINTSQQVTSLRVIASCHASPCELVTRGEGCPGSSGQFLMGVFCKDQAIDFRLNILPGESIGRLEAKVDQVWGPVCRDMATPKFAETACQAMGLPSTDARLYSDLFRGGDFPAGYLPLNECDPDSEHPGTCSSAKAGTECRQDHYLGLTCETATDKQIRVLSESTDAVEGVAQIYHKGQWAGIGAGTSDAVNQQVANVICRSLKDPAIAARQVSKLNWRPVWMNNVNCHGSEADLLECGGTDLSSVEETTFAEPLWFSCEPVDDAVRLANDGLLEIRHNGRWGTVCRNSVHNQDAAALCKKFGLPSSLASWYYGSNTPKRTGTVWLDSLNCDTDNWEECRYFGWGNVRCSHDEDVHIWCGSYDKAAVQYRLTHPPLPGLEAGYVEMLVNNTWGTVCDRNFREADAEVVCRSLNKRTDGAQAIRAAMLPRNDNQHMWLGGPACKGSEDSLLDCQHNQLGDSDCLGRLHSQAGVFCGPPSETTDGTFRLLGEDGNAAEARRLEVYLFGKWMSVCDYNFTDSDAGLICSILGFPSFNATVATKGTFPEGSGDIWQTRMLCSDRPPYCYTPYHKNGTCSHATDIGLVCQPTSAAGLMTNTFPTSLGFLSLIVVVVVLGDI